MCPYMVISSCSIEASNTGSRIEGYVSIYGNKLVFDRGLQLSHKLLVPGVLGAHIRLHVLGHCSTDHAEVARADLATPTAL